MNTHYLTPKYEEPKFTCPHCGALAGMKWEELFSPKCESVLLERAICDACSDFSIWNIETDEYGLEPSGRLIYPEKQTAPLPNSDLSDDCKKDYMEAREIQFKSPRGAAALLRLCIEKICIEKGAKEDKLFDKIGGLINKGIPPLAGSRWTWCVYSRMIPFIPHSCGRVIQPKWLISYSASLTLSQNTYSPSHA